MSDKYPKPAVTADVILLDRANQRIALIERRNPPFQGRFALPGGFFNSITTVRDKADASVEDAAWRELREETGVDAYGEYVRARGFSHFRDAIGRDPRERVISFVYFVVVEGEVATKADDDAKSLAWFSCQDLFDKKIPLAFDHQEAITKFLIRPQ